MKLILPALLTSIATFGTASAGPLNLNSADYQAAPAQAYASPRVEAAPVRQVAMQGDYGGGFFEMLFRPQQPAQSYEPAQPETQQRPSPYYYQQQDSYQQQGAPAYYQQRGEPADAQQQWLESQDGSPAHPAMNPRYLKQTVEYDGKEAAGTIVIDTRDKFLYLVEGGGRALRYGVGVGKPGFLWSGTHHVTNKREWPDWTPPDEMLKRRPDLPRHMVGGPENPLGARALYLGSTLYRIHGSNEPWTIGTNVSSGCIRMRNEDVIDLYGRVKVGTKVVVI